VNRRKKVSILAAIVGSMLLLALMASLASTTWATPAQNDTAYYPVLDKCCSDTMVARGQSTQFTIMVNHPISYPDTWYSTVLTDPIDANLQVTGVGTTRGYATWVGQDVTFTLGTMYPGDEAILTIDVRVREDAPAGYDVTNIAYLKRSGYPTVESGDTLLPPWMFSICYEQKLPLAMRGYR
jgi:hypothetical protein